MTPTSSLLRTPGSLLRTTGFASLLLLPAAWMAGWLPGSGSQDPEEGAVATEEQGLDELAPSEEQSEASVQILQALRAAHYLDVRIDDALSRELFDQYLSFLDPARAYFTAEDVAQFEGKALTLDDELRKGQVETAYAMYELYRTRVRDRLTHHLEAVKGSIEGLDFTVEETLELDRTEAAWAGPAELDEFWRKRFKNEVLNLKLAGREAEDIQKTLTRRYENQLHRLSQTRSEDVFQTYMNALATSWDPHTAYFPPHESENFDIRMSLSLEGIGALLGADGEFVRVERIIPGGPAEAQGELKAADKLFGVAQGDEGEMVDIVGWRTDEAVELIRGPKGSVVRLLVSQVEDPDPDSLRIVRIVRDEVKLEESAADSEIVEVPVGDRTLRVGVIDLPTFYLDFQGYAAGDPDFRSSTRDVARILQELQAEDVDGVVMDLRGNGGGSLIEATEVTGLFLGPVPVVQVRSPNNEVEVLTSHSPQVYDGPLVVLLDRLSASASEIFAGAIEDYDRGVVVGTRSFGKGTVQSVSSLGRGDVKLTQGKFYRVSGGSTQHRGVEPQIAFPRFYDQDEVGESALDDPLPWDQIDSLEYDKLGSVAELVPTLAEKHTQRSGADPAFQNLVERLDYLDEVRQRSLVSLHEETRLREREESEERSLDIENRLREAQGLEPYESVDAWDEAEESDEDEPTDLLRKAAAEVLADLVVEIEKRSI